MRKFHIFSFEYNKLTEKFSFFDQLEKRTSRKPD